MRRLAAFSVFVILLLLVLWLAAQALGVVSERQVSYRYISDALTPQGARRSMVLWAPPAADAALARPFTEADAALIGQALTNAWQALAVAQSTGRTDILSDSFSGVAQARALLSTQDAQAHGGRIAVLSQGATPLFYHLDGSVFQARVELLVVRHVADATGLKQYEITRDSGTVTLMNETNGWRVFSYERVAAQPLNPAATSWPIRRLRGLNYYPSLTPWRTFWSGFDPQIVMADFERIAGLGGNAVRIFLPRDDFSGADMKQSLSDLRTLLSLAEAARLAVVPTLFDLKSSYEPGTWAGDHAWLQRVLPVLAASTATTFIDLKNEPDRDFARHGTGTVQAWLRSMAAATRLVAPGLPVTVGWSTAEAAMTLSDTLDIITYHDYADPGTTGDRLANVRAAAGTLPVVVTEIGTSSFELALGFPGAPSVQAETLASRLSALAEADGVFVWTLHDFPKVDGSVIGASPWRKRLQGAFGLFDTTGAEKPAAAVVRTAFTNGR